jgi:hypothetical protein
MGQVRPEELRLDPARTARTKPHWRRSNHASANRPCYARHRKLRSDALLRLSVQHTKLARLPQMPQPSYFPHSSRPPQNQPRDPLKIKIPIDRRSLPAGSFLEDFRTLPASETLHGSGLAAFASGAKNSGRYDTVPKSQIANLVNISL